MVQIHVGPQKKELHLFVTPFLLMQRKVTSHNQVVLGSNPSGPTKKGVTLICNSFFIDAKEKAVIIRCA